MTYSEQAPQISPTIRVTEVGEYIRYKSCQRRFKLGLNNRYIAKQLPFAVRFFNTIDPVLQEAGKRREDDWEVSLQNSGLLDLTQHAAKPVDSNDKKEPASWLEFVHQLEDLEHGQNAYGREIAIHAQIGAFQISGQIDFIVVLWEDERPKLRIVECKASRKDKTYHRIQVALYKMLIEQHLSAQPLMIGDVQLEEQDIECVVARINEESNESQLILSTPPFDLDTEKADIVRLIGLEGRLINIVNSDLSNLSYQIESKCDDCIFSVHCLSESARERRQELLGLEPSTIRSLRIAGIENIDDLAELDLESDQACQVRQDTSFNENLESLQLKARSRRRTLPGGNIHPDEFPVTPLPNSGKGTGSLK